MGKLIFILGGAKSGKSNFALDLAKRKNRKVVFIATAIPLDSEMREKIKRHKNARPKDWKTIEITSDLDRKINLEKNNVILIDCMTFYLYHIISLKEVEILNHIKEIINAIKNSDSEIIVVSNEVGCGIVPNGKASRKYQNVLGKINQVLAKSSSEFYVMFAGVPVNVKKL